MSTKIKPIKSTVIKDKKVWKEILTEVQKKPSQEVIDRNRQSVELLAEMRR